ncbi:E4 ubiquitin-protein ligase UFD2 [Zancudomyces culisetae]|uniref:RING-type E3 ubiquitin transferase n=1 Tax=Zancudomyces culisetae TaxID=1213189 RepID=A0A1R1PYE1_ZANCU|nr:E4 ubiquitin-protein ligase UFD2 [Zancudomyces culisetae]|eukprot:OMH85981.1 E4 ubiquitin-protein ligase UFD2 [Zancudomyces culisetae]
METQLCDRNKLSMALAFMRFQLKAVLQVFSASVESKNQGQGQDQDQEGRFRFLPEFLVEDPSSLILFAARYAPDVLLSPELMPPAPAPSLLGDLYIDLVSLGLNNPESIRNPHLKSKLVDVVHALTYCDPEDDTDYVDTNIAKLQPRFMVHPVVGQFMMSLMSARRAKQLVGALLRLYVDVEHTESTSSFYDKFNTRYNIARILRSLWKQPQSHYLDETIEFFTLNPSKNSHASILVVERFVSRLTSDTTYLLDESLSKLSTIKSIEQDPNYINQNNNNNDNDNNDNTNDNNASDTTSQLLSAERQASIYITLAHETVHILAFLACKVPDPFRAEELVLRLAAMLNYNLDVLAGPKCNDLKVKNMYDRFRFNPRLLLSELLSVYTSLSTPFPQINHENLESLESSPPYLFLSALAQDSRSWSSSIFYKAIDLCSKYSLKPYSSLQQLARIGTTVNDLVLQFTDLDELTSGADGNGQDTDVPEEFLDPLMYTLMTDPVMLPTSNMVVDRKTIKAYLLNDPRDPFNRMPLDYCDVVEIPDLKRRIVEFRQLQREKLKNRKREA